MANVEQQISAMFEKDPYIKEKAKSQTIYLSERAACDKSAEIFGSLFTAFFLWQLSKFILSVIYGMIYGTDFGKFKKMSRVSIRHCLTK